MIADNSEFLLKILKEVIQKIELGIHVIDENEKTVIYNQKMMEIEGMDIEDVLDKNLLEVFQFDQEEQSTLIQVLKTGKSIQNVKQTYMNNKGKEITTINHTFPITDNGSVIGAFEIAKDVTKLEKMIRENLLAKADSRYTFESIIGKSPEIKELIETGKRATHTNSPILIVGETGTEKEIFAHSIHNDSARSDKPFISQNCAALPDMLIEELLFGTAEGAHTDSTGRPGLFEQADGGTLVLDEIHSLSPHLQAKLLNVIQEKQVRRMGDALDRPIDVRMVAMMNEDPIDAISAGKLRKDLFYRLSVVSLFIPPLRERKEDIMNLAAFFIEKYNHFFGMNVKSLAGDVKDCFLKYDWPGNVHELEHIVEGAMNLMEYEETLQFDHLPIQFRNNSMLGGHMQEFKNIEGFLYQSNKEILPFEDYIQEAETYYIKKALQHHDYNVTKTAKALGMSRQNLQYRLRKYEIEKQEH